MEKHYVDIDGYWGILFVYDFDWNDVDEVIDIIENFGITDDDEVSYAVNVLYSTNGGMTISRPSDTMSVIFIGQADSIEQFFDTLSHESDHAQDSILRYFGISHGTEDAAWLQGYIMRGISKWLKKDGYICNLRDYFH